MQRPPLRAWRCWASRQSGFPDHRRNDCLRASTFPSENRGPAILNPIGSPSFEKPHGIEIAGSPKMLNGVQFEMTSGSRGLGSSSRFSESLIVRGVMRMVGKATKSKFVKAINVFANGDQPPLRADVINHFLGTRLSGGIVHVLDCRIEILTNTKGLPYYRNLPCSADDTRLWFWSTSKGHRLLPRRPSSFPHRLDRRTAPAEFLIGFLKPAASWTPDKSDDVLHRQFTSAEFYTVRNCWQASKRAIFTGTKSIGQNGPGFTQAHSRGGKACVSRSHVEKC